MQDGTPNQPYNTLYNCQVFTAKPGVLSNLPFNPLVTTTADKAYFYPKLPYHVPIISPGDDGTEPAVAPYKNSWWESTSIWNRWSEDGNVVHQPPYSDDTANYMYVRITRNASITNYPVFVQLFLSEPGNSWQLYPLKKGNNNNNILAFDTPGSGDIVKCLAWSPKDTLQGDNLNLHHCVTAVIFGIDESPPYGPVTGLWLSQRAGIYRCVAQRNLGAITTRPPNLKLAGAADGALQPMPPHTIDLPWVQFVNPFEQPHRAEVTVDTTRATDLLGLTIEVDGDGRHQPLEVGRPTDVLLHEQMEKGGRFVLRLTAMLPPDLELRTEHEQWVRLSFKLDGEVIGGYTHIIQVGGLEEATSQVLDKLAGTLQHIDAGFTLGAAAPTAKSVKRMARSYGTQPERALEALRRKSGAIRDLAHSIPVHDPAHPEAVNIQRGLFDLAGLIASPAQSVGAEQLIERIRGLADRIQEPASRVAQRRQRDQAGNSESIVERPQRRFRVLKAE